ncbi:hypothetical protein OSTOST_07593 [Ostertagia ostertagi]
MTWVKLVELFETVVDLCEQVLFTFDGYFKHTVRENHCRDWSMRKTCENSLHQILLLMEQLYSDGHFAASPDLLYDLIEKCADRRPDTSVVKLIQYRAMAMSELHAFYTKYRALYEHELVTQLMIPVLQETENESSSRIQYLMLNILFDVAKTVSLRDDARLFESVMSIVRQLFVASILRTTAETAIEDEDDAETTAGTSRLPPRVSTSRTGCKSVHVHMKCYRRGCSYRHTFWLYC